MTFEAYIRNIETKTGKTPRELHSLANAAGVLHENAKAMEVVHGVTVPQAESRLQPAVPLEGLQHRVAAIEDRDEEADMRDAQMVEPHTQRQPSPAARARQWPERLGWVLSGLALLFFLIDALGKLLQVPQVLAGSQDLGYPLGTVVPIGMLLLVGAILYALPRSAVLGAIYLTAFLGGAVAAHVRIGSPLVTHILFGVYVAVLMWAGLVLRRPALLGALLGRH